MSAEKVLILLLKEKDRQVAWLCEEVTRLTRLVRDVERGNWFNGQDLCPWCLADKAHLGDCAAFQPNGRPRDMAAEALARDEAESSEIARRLLSGEATR